MKLKGLIDSLRPLRVFILILIPFYIFCGQVKGESSRDTQAREQKARKVEKKASGPEAQPEDHREGRIELTRESFELMGIETARAELRKTGRYIRATAEIQFNANKLFHIGPRVPGRVVDVLADLGDEVKKGQTLALLDSIELGKAISDYLTSQTRFLVQEQHYEREWRLWEKKVTTEKEVLDARSAYLQAKAEYEAAENKLHLLGLGEEEVLNIKSQAHAITNFPILCPFDGTVVEKHIALGETTDPTARLFTIADLSVLWIMLDIYEKDLAKISPGQEVSVSVTAYPDETFHGQIAYVSNVVEEQTRTVKVRVEIDNSAKKLKPGMFATARITTGKEEGSQRLAVPNSAVESHENKKMVFVSLGNYAFQMNEIKTGEEFNGYTEVLEGIKEGEEVVTRGSFYLKSEMLKRMLTHEHD